MDSNRKGEVMCYVLQVDDDGTPSQLLGPATCEQCVDAIIAIVGEHGYPVDREKVEADLEFVENGVYLYILRAEPLRN